MVKVYPIFYKNSLRSINYTVELSHNSRNFLIIIDPTEGRTVLSEIRTRFGEGFSHSFEPILINTHHHFDHVGGNKDVKFELSIKTIFDDKNFEEFNHLYQDFPMELITLQGHTLDHIGLKVDDEESKTTHWFFGDTLFHYGIGNIKNGGDLELFFETINKIEILFLSYMAREWNVKFYPAHDYAAHNFKFLQSVQDIKSMPSIQKAVEPKDESYFDFDLKENLFFHCDFDQFVKLRQLRDRF